MPSADFNRWTLTDDLDEFSMSDDRTALVLLEPVINDAFGRWKRSKLVEPAFIDTDTVIAWDGPVATELDLDDDVDRDFFDREVREQILNASTPQLRGYVEFRARKLEE
jgi:hypothetical protein